MKFKPLAKPTDPGFYWLVEADKKTQLVEVCVVSDSHSMFYVLLPDDDIRYPLDLWEGALWFGPLKEVDFTGFKK